MTHRELLGALPVRFAIRGGVARGGVALLLRVATALLEPGNRSFSVAGFFFSGCCLGAAFLDEGGHHGDDATNVAALGRGSLRGFASAGHA